MCKGLGSGSVPRSPSGCVVSSTGQQPSHGGPGTSRDRPGVCRGLVPAQLGGLVQDTPPPTRPKPQFPPLNLLSSLGLRSPYMAVYTSVSRHKVKSS